MPWSSLSFDTCGFMANNSTNFRFLDRVHLLVAHLVHMAQFRNFKNNKKLQKRVLSLITFVFCTFLLLFSSYKQLNVDPLCYQSFFDSSLNMNTYVVYTCSHNERSFAIRLCIPLCKKCILCQRVVSDAYHCIKQQTTLALFKLSSNGHLRYNSLYIHTYVYIYVYICILLINCN